MKILVRSDHLAITVHPSAPVKPIREIIPQWPFLMSTLLVKLVG